MTSGLGRGVVCLAGMLLLTSCVNREFEALRDSIEPDKDLAALLGGDVGAYLLEQRVKSFNGVRYSEGSQCAASPQQAEWLAGSSPGASGIARQGDPAKWD